jgi:(R,R)-butanediol dehydrogenase/meso-butanediol dehydrogenase/diacetyl reductase
MKAQVWHGKKDIRYEDVPDPFPAQDEWLTGKVQWAGICASDFHEYTSGPVFVPMTPHPLTGKCGSLIQGHEFSAKVVEVGKGVQKFKVGDRITSDSCIRCDDCYWCEKGVYNLCEKVAFSGEMADGAFAEYITVPEYSCYHLPPEISYEIGATVEPLAVAVHGIMRSKLRIGETAGIIGCGPIGLIALQVAKAAGASKVFAFEKVKSRQEMAKKLNADYVINPEDKKAMEIVKDNTNGVGPDVVLECVGSEKATQLAIDVARRGGRVSIIGIAHTVYQFNFNDIVFNEREVFGSCATTGGFPTALQYLKDKRVDTESLITGKILLKNLVNDGYEELLRNPVENFKILVTPDESLLTE